MRGGVCRWQGRALGRRLGLARTELVEVELGALLRDVGKLCLPRELLEKPGELTTEERRLIRLHPDWGADMVSHIPGLEAVALVVRLHHERPDGLGYPYGLTRELIPVATRIVSVCDDYGELERYAGAQFDRRRRAGRVRQAARASARLRAGPQRLDVSR